MRAVWLGGSTNAPSTSAVNYYALTGDLKHTPATVELARANILTDDVEITSIAAIVGNAPGTGKSWTLTVRNAGATTAASVTIGNTDQSAQWSGSVICPADTRLGLSITPSGTPAAIGSIQWVIGYQTGGNFYVAFSGRMSSPPNFTPNQYIGFNGAHDNAPSSSITAWAELAPTGYTVTKLGMAMGSSVLNGATVRCGKQGMATVSSSLAFVSADGNDAIGTLGTALHVDAGETAQIHLAAGGSLAWTPYLFTATIVPDIIGEQILSYSDVAAPSTSATQYTAPSGQGTGAWNATEAAVAIRAPDCRITKLWVQQVTAPGSGKSCDYALRQNGGYAGTAATLSGTATDANDGGLNTITYMLGDQLTIEQKPTGTPAASAGVKISMVLLIDQNVTGAIAATMLAATANLSGQVQVLGVMAATMRAPTAALAGQNSQSGALVATMRTMAVALTGSQRINGTLVAALRAAVAQLVGSGVASGTLAAQMRAVIALLDGDTTTGELAARLQRMVASVNGTQTVRGVLAATMRAMLFTGTGAQQINSTLRPTMRPPTALLIGAVVDFGGGTPPEMEPVRFAFSVPMPVGGIVSATQIVSLRTVGGVQLDQWLASNQTRLTWSRESRETSRCELAVINDGYRPEDIQPWLHWIDVFDDQGQTLLWSGPVTGRSIGRDQVSVSARDLSALAPKTRTRLTKRWDAVDPAVVAGEHYRELIDHHGLNTKAMVRNDPLGDTFDFSSLADDTQTDGVISQLVGMGLHWTVVRGVPILGPLDRKPVAALGEDDFMGGGITLTCDGTAFANDILLRAADNIAHAIVPAGGLAFQVTVEVNDMFGASNADKAVVQYARYAGSLRDTIAIPQGAILHPDAPITIDQLIPSARVTVTAFDQTFLMEVSQVEVSSGSGNSGSQVSVTLSAVDDDLPELVELQQQGATR